MENEYFNPGIMITTCLGEPVRDWHHPNLATPYWRLYWNRNPGADVTLFNRTLPLDRHHLILIPPDTPFGSRNSTLVEHLYIHFTAQPPFTGLKPDLFRIPIDQATQRRADELYQLSARDTVMTTRAIMLAFSLIHLALAHIPEEFLKHTDYDARVKNAIRLMEESPQAPLSNGTLARVARMNINAFIRLFKKQTGTSPQAFHTARRVEQACLLLHNSDASIKEIAERTGFCDRYHFSRVFARLRGISPALFRRRGEAGSGAKP